MGLDLTVKTLSSETYKTIMGSEKMFDELGLNKADIIYVKLAFEERSIFYNSNLRCVDKWLRERSKDKKILYNVFIIKGSDLLELKELLNKIVNGEMKIEETFKVDDDMSEDDKKHVKRKMDQVYNAINEENIEPDDDYIYCPT